MDALGVFSAAINQGFEGYREGEARREVKRQVSRKEAMQDKAIEDARKKQERNEAIEDRRLERERKSHELAMRKEGRSIEIANKRLTMEQEKQNREREAHELAMKSARLSQEPIYVQVLNQLGLAEDSPAADVVRELAAGKVYAGFVGKSGSGKGGKASSKDLGTGEGAGMKHLKDVVDGIVKVESILSGETGVELGTKQREEYTALLGDMRAAASRALRSGDIDAARELATKDARATKILAGNYPLSKILEDMTTGPKPEYGPQLDTRPEFGPFPLEKTGPNVELPAVVQEPTPDPERTERLVEPVALSALGLGMLGFSNFGGGAMLELRKLSDPQNLKSPGDVDKLVRFMKSRPENFTDRDVAERKKVATTAMKLNRAQKAHEKAVFEGRVAERKKRQRVYEARKARTLSLKAKGR